MDDIKKVMLETFQQQVDNVINDYLNKKSGKQDCLNHIERIIHLWDTARIDLKNFGQDNNVNLIDYSENYDISYPDWFESPKGKGCVISFTPDFNRQSFKIECVHEGILKIYLRGPHYIDEKNNTIPVYVNFRKFSVNNKIIFDEDKLLWHDEPHVFSRKCSNGQIINVSYEIDTIFDYYPMLKKYLLNVLKTDEDIKIIIQLIKSFIDRQNITR